MMSSLGGGKILAKGARERFEALLLQCRIFLAEPFQPLLFPQDGLLEDAAVAVVLLPGCFLGEEQLPAGLQVLEFFLVATDFFLKETGHQRVFG